MTGLDEVVSTKERPAALDGYERAKPDEPIFTLQGGDPVALKALAFYIDARRQLGVRMDDGRTRDAELVRCTEAEKILWAMQSYLRGEEAEAAAVSEQVSDVPEVVALHDYRVRAARAVRNSEAELHEITEHLNALGFEWPSDAPDTVAVAKLLFYIGNAIEPRRAMRGTEDDR